jgi:hypothetical protein
LWLLVVAVMVAVKIVVMVAAVVVGEVLVIKTTIQLPPEILIPLGLAHLVD